MKELFAKIKPLSDALFISMIATLPDSNSDNLTDIEKQSIISCIEYMEKTVAHQDSLSTIWRSVLCLLYTKQKIPLLAMLNVLTFVYINLPEWLDIAIKHDIVPDVMKDDKFRNLYDHQIASLEHFKKQ